MDNNTLTLEQFIKDWNSLDPHLLVHTSGSTGKPKALLVEKTRMEASARMTCEVLKLDSADTALLCLPLDYIAGKMVVVRSLLAGMKIISVPPSSHPLKGLSVPPSFAAMVPQQVYCSMQSEQELTLLKGIKNLIIGGGAIDKNMAAALKGFPNAVWSTYGMTETLSHIALRRLSGEEASDYYTPLNNVEVSLSGNGCLCIYAPKVCSERLVTNDIAKFKDGSNRQFRILGRIDNIIDSGGMKIQIEEVEDRLGDFLDFDFAITKQHDEIYGEVVVMLLARESFLNSLWNGETVSALSEKELPNCISALKEKIKNKLPRYWSPKHFYLCDEIPHTETGKIARKEASDLVSTLSPLV